MHLKCTKLVFLSIKFAHFTKVLIWFCPKTFCLHAGLARFVFESAFGFSLVRNKSFDLVSDWNGGSARGNSMGNHCGPIKGLSWELRPLQVIAEALCRSRGLQDRLGAPGEAIRLLNLVCSLWNPPWAAAYGTSSGQVPSASTSIEAFKPLR